MKKKQIIIIKHKSSGVCDYKDIREKKVGSTTVNAVATLISRIAACLQYDDDFDLSTYYEIKIYKDTLKERL